MKKILNLSFIIIFICSSPLLASNYYWVGGTGAWSDYAAHWATTSGGTVFHVTIPSPADDVFFDASSFPSTGDTVYMDTTITNCKSINWSSATNTPSISGTIQMDLYGSLILSPNMNWNCNGGLHLKSTAPGNIINTAGHALIGQSSSMNLLFEDTGTWQLQSALTLGTGAGNPGVIDLDKGTFYTNGFSINCYRVMSLMSSAFSLFLDTSVVNCFNWNLSGQSLLSMNLDADSAIIQADSFDGGKGFTYFNIAGVSCTADSCIFNDVSFVSISGNANTFHNASLFSSNNAIWGSSSTFNKLIMPGSTCDFYGSNQYDTLIFNNPGQTISIVDGSTISINSLLSADGNCSGLTSIGSTGSASIYKTGGTVTLNYILLHNISASGGATFIANNSVNAGNVSGFTINAPAPQNLYWVGGTGNWNDINHWATTSGGAGGSCVPNQFDNIFFDANSFPSATDTVYTANVPMYCHTMDWSAVTNSPAISGTMQLDLYGSFILSPNMNWNCDGGLHLKSTTPGNIINTAGNPLIGQSSSMNLLFEDTGTWQLQSTLTLGTGAGNPGVIDLDKGTFYTNGFSINCYRVMSLMSSAFSLFLDTSVVNCFNWNLSGQSLLSMNLDADSAIIQADSFDGGKGFTYFNIAGVSCTADSCIFNDVSFVSISGNANTFHNASLFSSNNAIWGSSSTFNKLIMPGSTCDFYGSNQYDTLIFNNPGQTISIVDGSTISINNLLLIQSDPGFPSSIECTTGTASISKLTDTICTDFIYLKNISATGGAVYFAGDHSVDLGGNTGWNWTRCAPLISNVWPGDCNYDLVTDNFDLLNIGVSFGDTGYVRPAASLSYTAQPCQDWYYQFINAANVKHADCNGNGIVDANDSTAISLNYGLTHPARLMYQDENNRIGTELAFVLPPVIVPGSSVSVPVTLGTNVYPASNIYGIAFTVNYDPAFIQPGTMSIDYTSSWVENAGNHLHLEKDFPGAGKTHIAFTRIDHSDASGYGMIATLNFIASPTANGPFSLSFSHVRVISHNEIEIPIQTGVSTTWVNIEETGNEISSTVFPNPMTKDAQVTFSNPNHETWYFTMKDLTGRIVSQQQSTSGNLFQIERKNLNSGIYFYVINNEKGAAGFGKLIID